MVSRFSLRFKSHFFLERQLCSRNGSTLNTDPVTIVIGVPSSNTESCAGLRDTIPLLACGQMNHPRSNHFAKRHNPSPSHYSILIRSPLRPQNTKTCPENGFSLSALCTIPLNPVNPRRRSVTPAAIRIRVPAVVRSSDQTLQNRPQHCQVYLAGEVQIAFRKLLSIAPAVGPVGIELRPID